MADAKNFNPSDNFNLEATTHEQGQVNQVGQITAHTVNFSTAQRADKPFQAPSLPPNFVERPSSQQAVKAVLLGQKAFNQGTLVISAIYGLGGIGKSTLAAAIAHDPDVKACFTDGVLWATLSKEPDLLQLLSSWIQALGDNNYKPIKPDDAKRHLQTLLYNKKVLLVVDDAWNSEHVEYFQVGSGGCRVLVTTREAVILGASCYSSLRSNKPRK